MDLPIGLYICGRKLNFLEEVVCEFMVKLKIHHHDRIDSVEAEENTILLQVLREKGYEIYSPCGGNGTCGKCKVWLKGEGSVSSCVYYISKPIEIVLPDRKEARILVEQHTHTRPVPFYPGPTSDLSAYPHGVALDLGTTSLVFYFVNLVTGALVSTRAMLNPQAQYGGDVISRINYTTESEDGLKELQRVIIAAINEQLDHFVTFAGISMNEIVKVTVSGNTTMLHLLTGTDPMSIALAPFTPKFTDSQVITGKDLNLHSHPDGEVRLLPSIAAYVGADIVGGLASIRPNEDRINYLFLDIGTNGELALGTPEGILCCSAAAGPAFEGARISCGMGGVDGAISAYDQNGYTVIGDVSPSGICGSGLIDLIAVMLDNGSLQSDGLLKSDFEVVAKDQTDTGSAITITQQDIREVQLAKSAIAAGIKVLLQEAGLELDDIDTVFLAGGFGNYINPDSAMRIGLISPELKGKIIPMGNTSGTGALLSLKSIPFDTDIEELRAQTRYIELSGHDGFTMEFAMNMNF